MYMVIMCIEHTHVTSFPVTCVHFTQGMHHEQHTCTKLYCVNTQYNFYLSILRITISHTVSHLNFIGRCTTPSNIKIVDIT